MIKIFKSDLQYINLTVTQKIILKEIFRRKINVFRTPYTNIFTAQKSSKSIIFINNYSSGITYNYGIILSSKYFARQILAENNIAVSEGKMFDPADKREALEYAKSITFPVLMRPDNVQSVMKGSMRVPNSKVFMDALRLFSLNQENVLIEKYKSGKSFRIFITRYGYINVLRKNVPFITGDGKSTFEELAEQENLRRINSEEIYVQPLRIDDELLENYKLRMDTILKKGKKVIFSQFVSAKEGATFEDVTKEIHPSFLLISKKILRSLPGMLFISFEMIAPAHKNELNKDNYIISELYVSPGPHVFFELMKGITRKNCPEVIVDLLLDENR